MSIPQRIEFSGANYHVMNRGVRSNTIYVHDVQSGVR